MHTELAACHCGLDNIKSTADWHTMVFMCCLMPCLPVNNATMYADYNKDTDLNKQVTMWGTGSRVMQEHCAEDC